MRVRGSLTSRVALLASAALVLAACSAAPRPGTSAAPEVRADVAFTCLWWSEAQMESLNPNAPPSKNTEVKLTKWEYSDPVGVPHPDSVDVVVTLANSGGQAKSTVEVRVDGEWKEGPLRDASIAAWSEPAVLQEFRGVSLAPSGPETLRTPVNLQAMMDSLAKQQKWPYALRVTVTVLMPGSAQPLAKASAELPIRPGD